jgi:hypothetical protein
MGRQPRYLNEDLQRAGQLDTIAQRTRTVLLRSASTFRYRDGGDYRT